MPNYKSKRVKNRGKIREHVLVVEAALGRILKNPEEVHHVDGVGTNNASSNLVLCNDHEYHHLLHIRTKALEETGNVQSRKCHICGEWGIPGDKHMKMYKCGERVRPMHISCLKKQNQKSNECRRNKRVRVLKEKDRMGVE